MFRTWIVIVLVALVAGCKKDLPTCSDGIMNGDETGIDCGGSCSSVCTNQFVRLTDQNSILIDNSVAEIVPQGNNTLWLRIGDEVNGEGIVRYVNDSTMSFFNTSTTNLSSNDLFDIHLDRFDSVWAAPFNGGLAKLNGTNWTQWNTSNSGIPSDSVEEIAEDSDGNLWLVTPLKGLAMFDGVTFTVYDTSNSDIPSNKLTAVEVDANDNVWIGSLDSGLFKFDRDMTFTHYDTENSDLSGNYVLEITASESGKVWVGTFLGGLNSIMGTAWQTYNTGNGLLGNVVDDIYIDPDDNLWVLSDCPYAVLDGNQWYYLGAGTDLENDCSNTIFVSSSGTHWVGTGTGLVRFTR